MTRHLKTTKKFERDLRRAKRRGKNIDKPWSVVARLLAGDPLDRRHRPSTLSGEWASFRECHLEPDRLLIWRDTDTELVLVRTGTHADLFD